MDKYAFGNRLCALRTERGYTQEKLGKMLGVSNKAVSKWENGTTQPRLQMLDKIAECFDMSVEELLEYGDEQTDLTGKKEIVIENPFKEFKPSAYTARLMRDLGFIKTDDSRFISEIKKEYGFTNKELAGILGVTQRTVGFWENGLKKPSAKNSIKIAALYYKNCDTSDKINSFSEYAHHFQSILIVVTMCILFAFAYNVFFMFPAMVSGDWALSVSYTNTPTPFSLKYFFLFVLPVAACFLAGAIALKYTRINRPDISKITNGIDKFRIVIYICLIIAMTVYSMPIYLTVLFGVYCVASFIFESTYNKKPTYSNKKILFATIPGNVFFICVLFLTEKSLKFIDSIPDSMWSDRFDEIEKTFLTLVLFLTFLYLIVMTDLTILLKNIDNYSKAISVVFKSEVKEYTPVSKRDKILFVVGLALVTVYSLIVIINAKYYKLIFYS